MLAVQNLALQQGKFRLQDVSLAVPTGQYGVLMGSTGCGKSSILEAIAGLRSIAGGQILLGTENVTAWPAHRRGLGYVPQDGALFRTMTVYQHLAFGLWLRRSPKSFIHDRVHELATWLKIEHLLERRPIGLSGGETQRVALGRALAYAPPFLLLDEPLSALDEQTRESMVEVLDQLRQRRMVTVLHVTHNSAEAGRLGDVRFRLDQGVVQVVG